MLKSQEINLDSILALIFENNQKRKDKAALLEERCQTATDSRLALVGTPKP